MKFVMGLCQMKVGIDKKSNLAKAEAMVREAAARGANVVSLPEIFNCPYANKYFREYAEDRNGETTSILSSLAKELGIYLIGGSIPEIEDGDASKDGDAGAESDAVKEPRVYNTCFVFDRSGSIIARHRKVHLFDVDVENGIRIRESDTITPGEDLTVFDTEYGRFGVAICYDIRFPELFRSLALAGAKMVILPAAFSFATGIAHWDITLRTRALDNQFYLAAVSPARDPESPYLAYGHSCIATPWGEFSAKTDHRESILIGEVDLDYVDQIRKQLPLLVHRKPELYATWLK
ncbi:MAG: carbon-nitrogen hydrolase [Firmicutes bacterium HGW-Firmicutes-11]|jgi:predicted amidohydrolase|nr:MAG: carbon-nitrogen hydrolase [Firmicutes bacterium HGW-Firmicutes-11]